MAVEVQNPPTFCLRCGVHHRPDEPHIGRVRRELAFARVGRRIRRLLRRR